MTSHAAVVARGMGRPCVAGAGSITVDYAAAKLSVGSVTVTEGQILTIDGSTGEVMVGEVPTARWPKPVNVFSLIFFDIFWHILNVLRIGKWCQCQWCHSFAFDCNDIIWIAIWAVCMMSFLISVLVSLWFTFAQATLRRFWSLRVMLARSTLTFLKTKDVFRMLREGTTERKTKNKRLRRKRQQQKNGKRTRSQTLPSLLKAQERTPAS